MVAGASTRPSVSRPCADRLDDIHRYIDGEVHPREKVSMADHLLSCAGCDAYAQEMQRSIDATRHLLKERFYGEIDPKNVVTKRTVMAHVESRLRGQMADRLYELAKARLVRIPGPAVHSASLPAGHGAILRRIRELVEQRTSLGEAKRSIRGPWADLKDLPSKAETKDAAELIAEAGDLLERAAAFAPEHGRARLGLATLARIRGDEERAWEEAALATRTEDVKTRCMAHVALANLCAGHALDEEAMRHLEHAQVYDETSPWPFYGLAILAFSSGMTREARKFLESLTAIVERSRRPEDVRRSIRSFLDGDLEVLGLRPSMNKLKQVHLSRMITQAAGELPESEPVTVIHEPVLGIGAWEMP